ncbi:MAG TPA: hypothetical protein VFL76_03185 [Edaphocola sp.]|nr:hypothetical protein [Edaphocola sp.]
MKKWLLMCLPLCLMTVDIWAQGCALCSLNAKSMGKEAGIGLNKGIIYLAVIPILFILTVGTIWFIRNRPDREGKEEA